MRRRRCHEADHQARRDGRGVRARAHRLRDVLGRRSDDGGSAARRSRAASPLRTSRWPTEVGEPEGSLSVLAWPGYAEDGSTDKSVDWVTPFEEETGCQVDVKYFGTSDEAVNLMKSGQYDVVSASGDASLRLIAGGDVAPVNTDLIPNYADVWSFLKDRDWNSVGGQMYGVPHGYGANLLMYNTDVVTPAPTSWSAVFDDASSYSGKVTAYDSPIYIADAALYLMETQPDLGIENPYSLDEDQLAAAVDLLKKQRENVGEYWSDYLKEIQSFKTGDSVVGTTWQVIVNLAKDEKAPVEAILPEEGATGWSDTWMVGSETESPNCAYRLARPHHQPRGQRVRRRVVRRGPGQREGVRPDEQGVLRDLPRGRRGLRRADPLLDDPHRAVPGRPHGRDVHDVPGLDPGLDRDQGLTHGVTAAVGRWCGIPPVGRAAPPPPAAAGPAAGPADALARRALPRLAGGAVHHLAVDRRRLRRQHRARLEPRQLPRPVHHRRLPHHHHPHAADRGGGDGDRRAAGVPDRALHGQGRLAPAPARARHRRADPAVGVVPRQGVRLARHVRHAAGRWTTSASRPATGSSPRSSRCPTCGCPT